MEDGGEQPQHGGSTGTSVLLSFHGLSYNSCHGYSKISQIRLLQHQHKANETHTRAYTHIKRERERER